MTTAHTGLRRLLAPAASVVLVLAIAGPLHGQPLVTDTLSGPFAAPVSLVFSTDGSRMYVANSGANTVSVINTSTGALLRTYPATDPNQMAVVVRNGIEFLYVANTTSIKVFDTNSDQAIELIPGFTDPYSLAVSPDGKYLYAANMSANSVSVVDTDSRTVIGTIPVGQQPTGVAFHPTAARAYVANFDDNTVSVINTSNRMVIATVNAGVGTWPAGLAVTPDGQRVYVTLAGTNQVVRLNTETNSVSGAPIAVGTYPRGVAIAPDGKYVYVANYDDGTLTAVSTQTGVAGAPTAVGQFPLAITLASDGTRAYVPDFVNDIVRVVALLPPDPPGNVTATPGDAAISVSWTAATSAAPVTGLTASASPGGQSCGTIGTSCTIAGLTNGTAYTVTVVATSGVGTSAPSAIAGPITPTAPKQEQKPRDGKGQPPKMLKTSGTTVLTGKNARTNAGQRIQTTVRVTGKAKRPTVIKGKKGKVSIRTYGPGFRVVLVQSAPATATYHPYRLRTVYRVK